MERNGVTIPDEYASSEEMIQAFLSNPPRPADPPVPADPPAPAELPTPAELPKPADPPTPSDKVDKAEYDRLKAEHEEFTKKYTELETKTSKYVDTDPLTYRLSHLKVNNPELFPIYASLKLAGGMKPIDLLVEDYVLENPEYKDKKSQVAKFIMREYGLNVEIPEPLDPDYASEDEIATRNAEIASAKETLELNEMKLANAYKLASQKFSDRFEAIELPVKGKTPEEVVAEKEQRKTGWKPVVDEVFKTVSSIPVFPDAKEGEKVEAIVEIPLTEDLKKEYATGMLEYLTESGMPLDKESLQTAYARFYTKFVSDNLPKIVSSVMKKARELTDAEYDKMYSNPSALSDGTNRTPGAVNPDTEFANRALELEGIRIK